MNRHRMTGLFLLAAGLCAAYEAKAQKTYEEMELLTVNEQVTTVITASEPTGTTGGHLHRQGGG